MATVLTAPMFASQYSPTRTNDEHSQYRPAKTVEAFNSLLPPAIEFVEGSSTGAYAIAEGKYEPINVTPKTQRVLAEGPSKPKISPPSPLKSPTPKPRLTSTSLYNQPIETTWPASIHVGVGFINTGNTCFLNSALQCLVHTPPLLRVLSIHNKSDPCRVGKDSFCMSCSMLQVVGDSFSRRQPCTPLPIIRNLHSIAKHLRKGRQEDSHEFLRYAIDALQKSCLAGLPPKLDPKIAETTWVHKIFGGRLRSRVTCTQCGHPSDTFDSILDLSIDIHGATMIKEALRKFTAIDYLKGADKYKCEKCKRPVNAEKQFTIHEAPMVLTIHLKRFTPMGRKLTHPIRYEEQLSLQSAMSEGQYGPTYSLYGVISHAGGGPNSGHYYAHVKAANGSWYEMNDDMVESVRGAPTGMKNAYILFYIRDKGQSLHAALNGKTSNHCNQNGDGGAGLHHVKKRKVVLSDDEEEDVGEKVSKPFIGPILPPGRTSASTPSTASAPVPNTVHPQTELLRKKIEAVQSKGKVGQVALMGKKKLVDYDDESSDKESGGSVSMAVGASSEPPHSQAEPTPSSSFPVPPSSPQNPPTSPLSAAPPSSPPTPIPPASFYGSSTKTKPMTNGVAAASSLSSSASRKRKSPEADENDAPSTNGASSSNGPRKSFGGVTSVGGNPFSRMKNNFDNERSEATMFKPRKLQKQYGNRPKRIMM